MEKKNGNYREYRGYIGIIVSQNRGTPISNPKYYNAYFTVPKYYNACYTDPQSLGNPHVVDQQTYGFE